MVVQVSFICASEHFFDNAEADSEKSVYSSGPMYSIPPQLFRQLGAIEPVLGVQLDTDRLPSNVIVYRENLIETLLLDVICAFMAT